LAYLTSLEESSFAKKDGNGLKYPKNKIIFANGGDRSDSSKILEQDTADKCDIALEYGVGGSHKESSSSDLLKRWGKYLLESKN